MEPEHKSIVRRMTRNWKPDRSQHGDQGLSKTRQPVRAPCVSFQSGAARHPIGQQLKRSRGLPDPRLRWMDVGKEAQDSPVTGRTVGKGVDVYQVVACARFQAAAAFLNGAKAGEIDLQPVSVWR